VGIDLVSRRKDLDSGGKTWIVMEKTWRSGENTWIVGGNSFIGEFER
jgi:hypothetical protein